MVDFKLHSIFFLDKLSLYILESRGPHNTPSDSVQVRTVFEKLDKTGPHNEL